MYEDYRVLIRPTFTIDIRAHSIQDAELAAKTITLLVFKESFGRAECFEFDFVLAKKIKATAEEETVL